MKHEPDLIPDLPLTSIIDRSKSNSLGKALLFVQVAWFCLSCASRLGEHLPLSLLEVSTLAHGLCTLGCYAVWWSKPLNIDEPTWIQIGNEHAREAAALMDVLYDTEHEDYRRLLDAVRNNYLLPQQFETQTLPLALMAAERYGHSPEDLQRRSYGSRRHFTFDSSPKFSRLFLADGLGSPASDYIATAGIPIVYGLLHFLGWHAQFPTVTERSLWRIATVVVMSSGAIDTVFFILNYIADHASHFRNLRRITHPSKNAVVFHIIPYFYTFGSMYLLVESIRQLWYLPPKAYVVASWSYIPPIFFNE